MNRIWKIAVPAVCTAGVLLAGCKGGKTANTTTPGTTVGTVTAGTAATTLPRDGATVPPTSGFGTQPTADASIEGGKLRLEYTGSRSSLTYVNSVDQLPDYAELAEYDAAFFEKHALLLVVDTESSGSIQVGFASIDPSTGTVTLSREMNGDVGTMDMATWLLWAVIDRDDSVTWSLENPSAGGSNLSIK